MHAYDNMKKRSKKNAADDKMERYKTGGGTFMPRVDTVDEKMLALLGNRATPLTNPYDCDALYTFPSGLFVTWSAILNYDTVM